MRSRTAVLRAGLIIASGFLCLPAAATELFVAPGDSGKLQLSVANLREVPVFGVQIPGSTDPRFHSEATGTQDITGRGNSPFEIRYTIPSEAQDGTSTIDIYPRALDALTLDPESLKVELLVDSLPPTLSFVDAVGAPLLNEQGQVVVNGDTIHAGGATVRANDTGGSGIALVTIIGPSPFNPTKYGGAEIEKKSFDSLENGVYTATFTDRAGNAASISFTISADQHAPRLVVRKTDAGGAILNNDEETDIRTFHIDASDPVSEDRPNQSGIERITIFGLDPHNDFENYIDFAGEAAVSFSTTLPLGGYWIILEDRAGNFAEQTFEIISSTGPISDLAGLSDLYRGFRGVSVSTPSLPNIFISQFDPVTGEAIYYSDIHYEAQAPIVGGVTPAPISQVRITGDDFNYVYDLSPPEAHVSSRVALTAGIYQATIKDISEGVTVMPFRLVDLTASICSDANSTFISTDVFTIDNYFCLKSSLGLRTIQELAPDPLHDPVGSEVPIQGTSLHYPLSTTLQPSDWIVRRFHVEDLESNAAIVHVAAKIEGMTLTGASSVPGNLMLTSAPIDLKPLATGSFHFPSARLISADAMISYVEQIVGGTTIDNSTQTIGNLTISFNGSVVANRQITPDDQQETFSGGYRSVGQYPVVSAELSGVSVRNTVYSGNCRSVNQSNPNICNDGSIYYPWLSAVMGNIVGVRTSAGASHPFLANVFSGGPGTIPLTAGVALGLPDHGAGGISLSLIGRQALSRYKALPANTAYRITAPIDLFGQPATISLPYNATHLTAGQIANLVILQSTATNPGPGDFHPIPSQASNGRITGTTSVLSQPPGGGVEFMVVAPIHEDAHVVENDDVMFQSNRADIQIGVESISKFSIRKMLAILGARGLLPVSPVYRVGPDGAEFPEPAVIAMKFSDAQLALLGLSRGSLRLIQFNEKGSIMVMPEQSIGNDQVSAKVPFLTSLFAVFGQGAPVYSDLSPPQTALSFTGTPGTGAGGEILLTTDELVRISAIDPAAPQFSTSGVSQTYFLLDQVFIDTISTPGTLYTSTFTLSTGTHNLAYYSVDNSGNVEPVLYASFRVTLPDSRPPRTAFVIGSPSTTVSGTTYVGGAAPLSFLIADDDQTLNDGLGVGATQTFYAVDGGAYSRYLGDFNLVAEGTRTVSFFSVDLKGNAEASIEATVFVDLTPPVTQLAQSGAIFSLSALDPSSAGGASGLARIRYLVDFPNPDICNGVAEDTAAARGTCENAWYAGPFALSSGDHLISFQAYDAVGNAEPLQTVYRNVDITPPVTTLGFNGYYTPLAGAAGFIYETSSLALFSFEHGSGLAGIYYAVDPSSSVLAAGLNAATTGAFEVYAGTFTLAIGRRTVAYGAVDLAGNYEILQSTEIEVGQEPGNGFSSGGKAIGLDPFNTFWTVLSRNDALSFAHANASGVLLASSTLQDGVTGLPWSVFFDAEGRAYAIGAAGGAATQALDLAIYKASPSGDAVETRTLYDSGYANNELVFDAKAPGWIVGAAQTSGPTNSQEEGARSASLALWRFDAALGTVRTATSYSRAGFDLGTGLAVDGDGSLWIAGYSLRPGGPESGGLDLALWHYAADGQTVLGGPFLKPSYLYGFDPRATARVHVTAAAVYVAAPRRNESNGTDLAFLKFDKATGRAPIESVWRADGGSTTYPVAILPEADGLLIAGGIGGETTGAMLWRFGYDGVIRNAATADAGGATGAVFKGSELWLSVNGSTAPYRVQSVEAAAGAMADISTVSLASISVAPATATILTEGTVQFLAVGTFTNGSTRTMTASEVAWSTDDSAVATIDANGLATGVFGGTAHVTAASDGITGQAVLTVNFPPPPTVVGISPSSARSGETLSAAVVGTNFDRSAALTLERSDALRGTWTPTGSFTQGRYASTLTKLGDGRVLLAGGIVGASTVGSADTDLYDPATGLWTAGRPLNQGRNQYAAVALKDGRVLVAGGYGSGPAVKSVEIYDPILSTWTLAAPMSTVRVWPMLAVLNDGRVLAAGGHNGASYLNSAEIYDPERNEWTLTGALSGGRAAGAMATLEGGKVLIVGGFGDIAAAEVYDPIARTWSSAGSMSTGRALPRVARLPSGKVLVSGGGGSGADVYDPVNGWAPTNPMMTLRIVHEMVLVNGTALAIGGQGPSGDVASTEIYDAASNAWRLGPELTAPRIWPLAAVLDDGRVLVAGGQQGGANLNTAELLGAPATVIAATNLTRTDAQHLSGTLDLTGAATGYWDVVVRASGERVGRLDDGFRVLPPPPTLASIAVTPAAATILAGTTAQFTAAGTFTDGSTRTLTSGEVVWSTDFSMVALVDANGLATGVAAGDVLVIASSGSVTGHALLKVRDPPPTVAGISPSSGEAGSSVAAAVVGTHFDASAALSLEQVSDVLRGTWTPTGSFTQGRYASTLTKLGDGRVLLAGGIVGASTVGSADTDLYNPATGLWTAGPPMNQGRNQYAAVALKDGRVLVAGGYGSGPAVKSVEIYDPILSTWTLAAPMSTVRVWPMLAVLNDGRVLVAGGHNGASYLNSAEIYDPERNEWTLTGALSGGRAAGAMATLEGGKVLIVGGFGDIAAAEVYDPLARAWSSAGSMSTGRALPRVARLPSGKVLVSGGGGSGADVYDPVNGWAPTNPMVTLRIVHDMVLVNGTALAIGGQGPSGDVASTEIYDAASNAWRLGPQLTAPRIWPLAAVLDDGRVLVAGGQQGGANLNTAELLGAPATVIAATNLTRTDAQHLSGTLDLTGAATGYWDVVVRASGERVGRLDDGFHVLPAPPPLLSIAVTPSTAAILAGATAQFTAEGTYADGSTRTLTVGLAWSTDVSTVATIDASGMATGRGGGAALILASSGAVSGQAVLTVAYVATSTVTVNGEAELTLVSTAPFTAVLVSTEAGEGAVALGSAAAQGLILLSTVYDVTREDKGATAVLTWNFDPASVDEATLAIWRFDGIAWSSVTVLNQVVTVSEGVGTITGEVVLTSLYALFSRETAAPVTTVLVDGLPAGGAILALLTSSILGFTAVDAGAGVRETLYTIDGGAETVFAAPFSLTAGAHTLSYRSVDRAGNYEEARAVELTVTNPVADLTPPVVRLDFPGASALGVEQAISGVVNVRGAASDESPLTWTVTVGLTVLASGSGNVSGVLAAWDTAALTGAQTVTLTATDAYGNTASTSAQVFVGAPVMTFAIGRKDSNAIVSTLKGPTGIAARADGSLWVASTENDKILLISPAGNLLGEAGGAKFKSPQGLALDAAGNLYVADRDMDRVAKLSPDGQVLLLQIGKLDKKGKSKPGSGQGELRNPFDVAVDGNGDIYAADSGNRRIQVFDAAGAFLREFGQGVLLSTSEIRGIALTSEGLWVSDKELEVIHLFSRAGSLIKTIGAAESVVGELSRTRGLAADRLGALYVVEPNRDRAQKFDPQGKGLIAFGSRAGLSHADKHAKRFLTQPLDAAVAPDGSIWFTDAGRDRIVRYALPAAGGYGVAALSAGGGASSSIEPAKRVIDYKDGAKVERDDGAGVRVPKGALKADLEITVDAGDEEEDKEHKTAKRRDLKITPVSAEVQYGPEGTTFDTPVTLILPYDANLLASKGIKEDDLKVYYWNPGLKDWQAMPSTVDKQNKTVNAQTNHFSAYQVNGIGNMGGIGVAALDDFGLRDGYAFPNPARGGASVNFRMQPGSADSIEVRVYDVSGRKVHSSSDFRFRGAFDDGNGLGAQNTYDHVWDVSGVGSGVYAFIITAKKAGAPDVRKTGRVGVIK